MSSEHQDLDLELVERAKSASDGDYRAFDRLVERHTSRVVTNCRYMTRSEADAEDLAQEVFVKAFFGLRRFEGRAAFRTWLQRIKVNHCLNFIKKNEGKEFVDLEGVEGTDTGGMSVEPEVERRTAARDDRMRIERSLDAMADTLRIPLILRDMDEMTYQEIAEMLGIGLSATKMRIKRAREEFRRRYDAESTDVP